MSGMTVSLIENISIIMIVWMIGFSGDARALRVGGLIILGIKWLAPIILFGTFYMTSETYGIVALISTVFISLLMGSYLIFWSLKSTQNIPIRIALALAGLATLIIMILPIGVLAFSGLASAWFPNRTV